MLNIKDNLSYNLDSRLHEIRAGSMKHTPIFTLWKMSIDYFNTCVINEIFFKNIVFLIKYAW